LQGGLRYERTCFDVKRYDLNIRINPKERTIKGFNDITFTIVEPTKKIQIDLFENMNVDSIVYNKEHLYFKRDHHAVFVLFNKIQKKVPKEKSVFIIRGNL